MPKPTPPGPSYEVVGVTPELAEKWLEQNTHNRNLRPNAVYAYARDMEAGRWAENGESIKFAVDGTLLDGQHRLQAVALAGVTVRMLVVTGLASAVQETVDDGRKRTLADALSLRGESHCSSLGAVLRRAFLWDRGIHRHHGNVAPTNTECLNYLAEHPGIRESAAVASAVSHSVKILPAVVGLTHWVFTRIDQEDADWFFERLESGVNLPEHHPILTLRKRAQLIKEERARVSEDVVLAYVIKTWNAYRKGEQVRVLRFRVGGANPEEFPLPE